MTHLSFAAPEWRASLEREQAARARALLDLYAEGGVLAGRIPVGACALVLQEAAVAGIEPSPAEVAQMRREYEAN
jgi:hypothetical protein